ncbi:MAG: hypothetical protein ACO3FS_06485 [Flavobacteriaceae bacterium]
MSKRKINSAMFKRMGQQNTVNSPTTREKDSFMAINDQCLM